MPTKIERNVRPDKSRFPQNLNLVTVFILGTGDKYRVLALDDRRQSLAEETSLRIARHKKHPDGKRR